MKPPKTIWFRMRQQKPGQIPLSRWHYLQVTGTHKSTMRRDAKDTLRESHGRAPGNPWAGPREFEECHPAADRLFVLAHFGGVAVLAEKL